MNTNVEIMPSIASLCTRRTSALVGLLVVLLTGWTALAATTVRADPAASYSFDEGDCNSSARTDPLNVRWFNEDYLAVKVGAEALLPRWGNVAGGVQYAYNNGTCQVERYSEGVEFGPPSRDHSKVHREKIHMRLFETGTGQVGGDAHRERKVRCDNSANTVETFSHDVVYKYFNGSNGFDAAMDKVVSAFRKSQGSTISVVRSGGPFVSMFQQCNGTWVPWSGDVAYITRNSTP